MSLTIVAVLFFSLVLLAVNPRNKYNYFFILMMLGMAMAMATIVVEIAVGSNYILPAGYWFRSLESALYTWLNRILRIPLSSRLVLRNIGIGTYMIANVFFVFSFHNSISGDERRSPRVGNLLSLLFPAFYFLFYHPATAYWLYITGNGMATLEKRAAWFFAVRVVDNLAVIGTAIYLAYPIFYLLRNYLGNRITFFSEQLLGLAVSLALLNGTFFCMFFLGLFRLSTQAQEASGLWRYAFMDRIPLFYVIYLPFVMLLIECIVLYIIVRYKASDIVRGLKLRMVRKNLSALYQNQRDILHSNKNLMFRIKLLSQEALEHYGTERGQEKLEAILNLCEGNMNTISKTLDYIKVLTIRTVHSNFVEAVESALQQAHIPGHIRVVKNFGQQEITCFFDRYHMEQSIANLLDNAVDAIRSNGRENPVITVTLHASNNWIYFSVSDTGCGIPRKMQKKIFSPYVSTKSKQNNWGLGLSYVFRIVKAHYGQIRMCSKPNRDTVVEMLLPRTLSPRRRVVNMQSK